MRYICMLTKVIGLVLPSSFGIVMVEGEVLKVEVVEGEERGAVELSQLEQLAARIIEVEKLIEDCKGKLSEAEGELAEFRRKSELERRFSELAGIPYVDKSQELEEKVTSLKAQLESLSSERVKIRGEILSGLAGVIMPIEAEGRQEDSVEEVSFKFRDGLKCPAITAFLKKELNFGLPPVYVTLTPEGLKVVGVSDKSSAVKEVIKAVEGLRAKAAGELKHYTPEILSGKLRAEEEETPVKGVFAPFRKLKH
jgi:transposase